MTPIDYYLFIFGVSGGLWMLYCLYITIRVKRFIVKRYEQETDLLKTRYFTHHATYTRYLTGFLSTSVYVAHLTMCLWGWRFYQSHKAFKDIEKPEDITRHFSKKEICMVKKYAIAFLGFVLYMFGVYVLRFTMPEIFND